MRKRWFNDNRYESSSIILLIINCFWLILIVGCAEDDGSILLPIERISFPVSDTKIGETKYVAANAFNCATDHRFYIYSEAPTFVTPYNEANIAIRRNNVGFDVDLSTNSDFFLPLNVQNSVVYPVTSINSTAEIKNAVK